MATRVALLCAAFLAAFPVLAVATSITQITFDPAVDSAPSWSPDGTRLAMASDRGGSLDIWVMEVDGSHAVQLTTYPGYDGNPSWSPDGEWIIFDTDRDGSEEELYRVPSAGGVPVRVTRNSRRELEPNWASTGSWVVCATWYFDWEIAVYDAFSGVLVYLVTDHPAHDVEPGFDPIMDRVVFQSNRDGNREIYLAPIPAGPLATRVTFNPGNDIQPNWSHEHGLIAFASDRVREGDQGAAWPHGGFTPQVPDGPLRNEELTQLPLDIWITEETGRVFQPVTDDAQYNHRPRWSPDGMRIAFQSLRSGNWDIFIADDLPIVVPASCTTWGQVKARFAKE